MTREEAIAYFEQHVEIMEQPPIHLGSAVAVEEWAKRCDHLSGAYRWAISALREQESDAVQVVRCKDCCAMYTVGHGYRWCKVWERMLLMGEDGFCSYGERKDGEE